MYVCVLHAYIVHETRPHYNRHKSYKASSQEEQQPDASEPSSESQPEWIKYEAKVVRVRVMVIHSMKKRSET